MKIEERIESDMAFFTIGGKMMGGEETFRIHERVKELAGKGIIRIVVDMQSLEWLNSAGLGILIASMITLRRSGGDLILVHVHGKAKEVIDMTHLNSVFRQCDSVEKALVEFKQ